MKKIEHTKKNKIEIKIEQKRIQVVLNIGPYWSLPITVIKWVGHMFYVRSLFCDSC